MGAEWEYHGNIASGVIKHGGPLGIPLGKWTLKLGKQWNETK